MKRIILGIFILSMLGGCGEEIATSADNTPNSSTPIDDVDNTPVNNSEDEFLPENFIEGISNPFFSLKPGRKLYFDGKDENGAKIHKELLASDTTKEILGVTTQAMWERLWKDDSLVSDVKRWYAQDKDGNVWLFAEDELNIFGGYVQSPGDSWISGVGEAKPGIVVPADPNVGDAIKREHNGLSNESSQVIALNQQLTVPGGQFKDCLEIKDEILGEETVTEHNYYCRELGNLAQEKTPDTFGQINLTKIEDNFSTAGMNIKYPELEIVVSEADAKDTAIDSVATGESADSIVLALKDGKPAYLVTVVKENGNKVPVYINITTGAVIN